MPGALGTLTCGSVILEPRANVQGDPSPGLAVRPPAPPTPSPLLSPIPHTWAKRGLQAEASPHCPPAAGQPGPWGSIRLFPIQEAALLTSELPHLLPRSGLGCPPVNRNAPWPACPGQPQAASGPDQQVQAVPLWTPATLPLGPIRAKLARSGGPKDGYRAAPRS